MSVVLDYSTLNISRNLAIKKTKNIKPNLNYKPTS